MSLKAVVLGVALAAFVAPPAQGQADHPPADVVASSNEGASIPPLPSGFVTDRVGDVTWSYHPSNASIAEELQSGYRNAFDGVVEDLGAPLSRAVEIRIARGPTDMLALAPAQSPPPHYAVGVAYPKLGLIILSVVTPESWLPPDMQAVLTHELSHIVLYRRAEFQPLPRWFVEGLAVYQAGEQKLSRVRTLWEAAVFGKVLPVSQLSYSFPSRSDQANLAYAQSADLVRHLLREGEDHGRLRKLLQEVAQGAGFDQALLSSYHIDTAFLEREWRATLGERFRALPLVLTGTTLWTGMALLLIVGYLRKRRIKREKLARWAEEEAAEERALAARQQAQVPLPAPPATLPEPLRGQLFLVPPPRDSGIPTIEHDGQRHTLH